MPPGFVSIKWLRPNEWCTRERALAGLISYKEADELNILLTGGTGYIGSHAAVVLIQAGHRVVLYDNLCNSEESVKDRLHEITHERVPLIKGDIRDTERLKETLQGYQIDAVMHFAGLKAVGESVLQPIDYYHNNVYGSLSLLKAMQATAVRRLVFSSSATVYGDPKYLPMDEAHPTAPTNPYGWNKLHIEQMLSDLAATDSQWRIACLRYFNPAGAHESGLIGENPNGIPNNLMPYVARVANGQLPFLNVFGGDYSTPDGTGVRDYIHVMDLAEGHLAALGYISSNLHSADGGLHTFNLGTGCGYSVLDVIKAYEKANQKQVPYQLVDRRAGDVAACYANANKAKQLLKWQIKRDLPEMCASAANFKA